jgi:hypothetical protein
MTEMEFDETLSLKLREVIADRRLPENFPERLARSARRAKTAWRIKVAAVIVLTLSIGIAVTGISRKEHSAAPQDAALIAADAPSGNTQVSSWFLLGYLRECFKRNRNNRKKEN